MVDISATATSISLQWSVIAGVQPSGYTISYSNTDNTDCFTISDTVSITDGSDMDYVIEGLEEGTEYTITVTLLRDDGPSDEDTEIQATADTRKLLDHIADLLHVYLVLVSSAAPTSVSVLPNVTSSSITVQWEMVPCIHRNGDITGYSVRYAGSGSIQTMAAPGDSSGGMATISGLSPATGYMVEIAAVNSAGPGVYSDPVPTLTSGNGLHCWRDRY